MAEEYRSGAPEDWFVDPARRGVPGTAAGATPSSGFLRHLLGDDEDGTLAWQSDALCAQTDPEAFFPEKGGSTRDAKAVCHSCEVVEQCLAYALQNDERYGIWGGLSERERRALRRRRVS